MWIVDDDDESEKGLVGLVGPKEKAKKDFIAINRPRVCATIPHIDRVFRTRAVLIAVVVPAPANDLSSVAAVSPPPLLSLRQAGTG